MDSLCSAQRYTYRVLQTIQMKLIFLCVWAEQAVLGKYEYYTYNSMYGVGYKLEKWKEEPMIEAMI